MCQLQLLGKHGLSTVDDITFALVERLTGNELDAIHKFKIGKAAKGNVGQPSRLFWAASASDSQ